MFQRMLVARDRLLQILQPFTGGENIATARTQTEAALEFVLQLRSSMQGAQGA